MGETASKLRIVFDAMATTRGVYFFDEFDAIGSKRGERNDVGEIRRVLNSFLQLLEKDDSDGLIIAATNHPELLDPALFRRFDDVIHYSLPDNNIAVRILGSSARGFAIAAHYTLTSGEAPLPTWPRAMLSRSIRPAGGGAKNPLSSAPTVRSVTL